MVEVEHGYGKAAWGHSIESVASGLLGRGGDLVSQLQQSGRKHIH